MSGGDFSSITRTPDELSVVCAEDNVPPGTRSEGGWCCLKLAGPFAFDMTGVLASILVPLAEAGIGILGISTFDTDYVLVKAEHLDAALDALERAGHQVLR
ncbi:MAG: ACT domain-containing protein [Anaerolineae bacterium]